MNFQSVKLDLEKAEEQEVKLRTSVRSSRSKRNSGKTYISALLIMPKPLTVWVTKNCGKFFHPLYSVGVISDRRSGWRQEIRRDCINQSRSSE